MDEMKKNKSLKDTMNSIPSTSLINIVTSVKSLNESSRKNSVMISKLLTGDNSTVGSKSSYASHNEFSLSNDTRSGFKDHKNFSRNLDSEKFFKKPCSVFEINDKNVPNESHSRSFFQSVSIEENQSTKSQTSLKRNF